MGRQRRVGSEAGRRHGVADVTLRQKPALITSRTQRRKAVFVSKKTSYVAAARPPVSKLTAQTLGILVLICVKRLRATSTRGRTHECALLP